MSEKLIAGARRKSDDARIKQELRREAARIFPEIAQACGKTPREIRRAYRQGDEAVVAAVEAKAAEAVYAIRRRLGIDIDWDKLKEWFEFILRILSLILPFFL